MPTHRGTPDYETLAAFSEKAVRPKLDPHGRRSGSLSQRVRHLTPSMNPALSASRSTSSPRR